MNDAAHGQETVHLVAHMHQRDGHAVVFQFARIGHSFVGQRVVTEVNTKARASCLKFAARSGRPAGR